jgi:hypothetical protein
LEVAVSGGLVSVVGLLAQKAKMGPELRLALWFAARSGQPEFLERVLAPCLQAPQEWFEEALNASAAESSLDIVERLASLCDPAANDSAALRQAAENGTYEIVKFLEPRSNPSDLGSEALRSASRRGDSRMVEVLLPRSFPEAIGFEALRLAASYGHAEAVALLLKYGGADRTDDHGRDAFGCACAGGHLEAARILLPKAPELGAWGAALARKGLWTNRQARRLRAGLTLWIHGASEPSIGISALAPAPGSSWAPMVAKMARKRCKISKRKSQWKGPGPRLDKLEAWLDGYELSDKEAWILGDVAGKSPLEEKVLQKGKRL